MSTDPTRPERPGKSEHRGRRAHSRIGLEVDVDHDGDPWVLGQHLAAEVPALLRRWGSTCDLTTVVSAVVLVPGDALSPHLPAIGAVHEPGTDREAQGGGLAVTDV